MAKVVVIRKQELTRKLDVIDLDTKHPVMEAITTKKGALEIIDKMGWTLLTNDTLEFTDSLNKRDLNKKYGAKANGTKTPTTPAPKAAGKKAPAKNSATKTSTKKVEKPVEIMLEAPETPIPMPKKSKYIPAVVTYFKSHRGFHSAKEVQEATGFTMDQCYYACQILRENGKLQGKRVGKKTTFRKVG